MKKTVLTALALMMAVVMLSLVNFSAAPVASVALEEKNSDVITVANSKIGNEDKILEARFLNMLNHSYAYNEALDTEQDIVNSAVLALLSYSEDGYIPENVVSDYIFNMYGVIVEDYSAINPEFDYKSGYVFVLPRGYENYKHTISSVNLNEDGSYTVETKVEISSHDSGVFYEECETLFVENENSQFGFNIIFSNFGSSVVAI